MTEFVKTAIENNIDAIEHNEWEEFFYQWCLYNPHPKDEPRYWDDFVQIFNDLNIFVDYRCTKSAVTKYITKYILDEKHDNPKGFLGKSFLISKASKMNIDEDEAKQIVEDVTKEQGLTEFTIHSTEGYLLR